MAKTIVITGASDGVGAAGARQLHRDGHHVVVVGRSPEKTRAVAEELGTEHFTADFADLGQVRRLAADLLHACPRIDVLVNNAGGLFGDRERTVDGFEKTFQVNHLAPFLLTTLLMDRLIADDASVVQTSSAAHRMMGRLDIDDLNHDRKFSAQRAYSVSKLENILFTTELHRRYHDQGISAVAFHPGVVASSFASTSTNHLTKFFYASRLGRSFMVSSEKGADQLVWLATAEPGKDWDPGTYYEKRRPGRLQPQAHDADLARQLWDRSEQLLSAHATH
jgi:NAD(P)-dependent dehydrogenase (short-subunit alcohol dehydrogenase family)